MSSSLGAARFELQRQPGKPPLHVVDSGGGRVDPVGWATEHRAGLRAAVGEHGSVLVRGLGLGDPGQVAAVFGALAGELMADRESFAARQSYPGGVYSSSKWPANQPMCMHHELSYALEFPSVMLFACLRAPVDGSGATAVADAPTVRGALPPELVARFEQQGWLLTRSYNEDIGAPVADAFGTEDRAAIEAYCRANGIGWQWQPDGGLRTRQHRHAVVGHPGTGLSCWFNQIAFLNEWTLDPEVREFLVDMYGPQGLPFNTYHGDGEPIDPKVIALINEVYEAHTVREPWRDGDLMVVDNIRTAHSREAYTGQREVLVGMAEPLRLAAPEAGTR